MQMQWEYLLECIDKIAVTVVTEATGSPIFSSFVISCAFLCFLPSPCFRGMTKDKVRERKVPFLGAQKVPFLYPLLRKNCSHNCAWRWPNKFCNTCRMYQAIYIFMNGQLRYSKRGYKNTTLLRSVFQRKHVREAGARSVHCPFLSQLNT